MNTIEIKDAVARLTQTAEQIDRDVHGAQHPYGHASLIITANAVTVYITIGLRKMGEPLKVSGDGIPEAIAAARKALIDIGCANDRLAQTLGLEVSHA
jgi:hypothetical protein